MTELQHILASLTEPGVLATVVRVEGSAYRQPGARMFIPRKPGRVVGTISGGCLEADLVDRAWALTEDGGPQLVRYDSRDGADVDGVDVGGSFDDWGFGMGCNGAVDVLIERVDPADRPDYFRVIESAARRGEPVAIATVFAVERPDSPAVVGQRFVETGGSTIGSRGDDIQLALRDCLRHRASAARNCCGAVVFFEFIAPPRTLLICGAGFDAIPLARLAAMTGWGVIVCDRRETLATTQRFPDASVIAAPPETMLAALDRLPDAAVIMTHRFPEDVRLLGVLGVTAIPYVGVLGPRDRTRRLIRAAGMAAGVEAAGLAERLHAPVGLDLGSETPQDIALSILAEATAVLHGRVGGTLRDSDQPIHRPAIPHLARGKTPAPVSVA